MHVLVVGGTGFIGQHLCGELVDRGHDVRALARDPAEGELPDGVEPVAGDVTDYESITGAFDGIDAVVNLVALSPLFKPKGGEKMHDRIHREGTANCVRAAETYDVDRFVQLSALGADADGPTHYLRAKGEAETIVREADVDHVIVRPSIVFGDGGEFLPFTLKLTPPYLAPLPGGGKTTFQPIWIEDFAPMLADAIDGDEHATETYEIGGPDELTIADVARIARRARGQSVRVLPVPMPLAGIGLSVLGKLPFAPMGADQYRSLKLDNTIADNDVAAFDVSPDELTTLETYVS